MTSKRRGNQHLKRRRRLSHFVPPQPGEEIEVAAIVGAAAEASHIPEARLQTHDLLISQLGARRRSGVRWVEVPAPEAPTFLAKERAASHGLVDNNLIQDDDGALAFLVDNPDGYLVVAMCEAVR